MDSVVVLTTGTIGVGVSMIAVGAGLAALVLSGQREIRAELRSISERLTGIDRSLSRLEGAFSVAFALPRPPAAGTESPPASVTRPEPR